MFGGQVVESYVYDSYGFAYVYDRYGQLIVDEESHPLMKSNFGNPFMFTGRQYDTETGLYYYRARYYNPYIGRFMQPDPISYADSMNLYSYVDNNPLNWIDPYGLCKDNFVEITDDELACIMRDFYESKLRGHKPYTIGDWASADTSLRDSDHDFIYKGVRFRKGQVNYIGIGLALRYFNKDPFDIFFYPQYWHYINFYLEGKSANFWVDGGKVFWTKYGYESLYPIIYGKEDPYSQSICQRARNFIRRNDD